MATADGGLFAQLDDEGNDDHQNPHDIGPVPGAFRVNNPGKQGGRKNIGDKQQEDDKAMMGHDEFPRRRFSVCPFGRIEWFCSRWLCDCPAGAGACPSAACPMPIRRPRWHFLMSVVDSALKTPARAIDCCPPGYRPAAEPGFAC